MKLSTIKPFLALPRGNAREYKNSYNILDNLAELVLSSGIKLWLQIIIWLLNRLREESNKTVVIVYSNLEMMVASELQGFFMSLGSKKPSFHRDRNLPSSFTGSRVNLLHSKNVASGFRLGKYFSVTQRNTTRRFLATSTLADVANDFMVTYFHFASRMMS